MLLVILAIVQIRPVSELCCITYNFLFFVCSSTILQFRTALDD